MSLCQGDILTWGCILGVDTHTYALSNALLETHQLSHSIRARLAVVASVSRVGSNDKMHGRLDVKCLQREL